MPVLEGKKALVGITGGIAAYKAVQVVRELRRLGARVQVVMTRAAQEFVSPLTFETLSGQPVLTDLFGKETGVGVRHVEIPAAADLFLVCPATANFLGKVAHGIADDLLTTMALVAGAPKTLICPAMNTAMWENPAVQENVQHLKKLGYRFIGPEFGELASGAEGEGMGRLAAVERIVSRAKIELLHTDTLAGSHFVISAGPTEEPLDPVRFLTNASSGKMGYALAEAALSMGATVTLITGPTVLLPPDGAEVIKVRTALDMHKAVLSAAKGAHCVIMAAAVADYRPAEISPQKLKKAGETLQLKLVKNPDILGELGARKENLCLVGFAVETENAVANAAEKMRGKNLDMVVVNNPMQEGAGFHTDTNIVTILTRDGDEIALPKMSKFEVALRIMDEVAVLMGRKPPRFRQTIEV